jgi:nitrogenase subunit NifH
MPMVLAEPDSKQAAIFRSIAEGVVSNLRRVQNQEQEKQTAHA